MTLTEFLLARIAEDEAVALEFRDCEWAGIDAWGDGTDLFFGENPPASVRRVLAECEAKRQIVKLHTRTADGECVRCDEGYWTEDDESSEVYYAQPEAYPCQTLRTVALPYADHPDYRDEWKP